MFSKSIRNTAFTLIILVLTAVGLEWNNQVVKNRRAELAANSSVVSSSNSKNSSSVSLEITIDKPQIKVSETFELTILTNPNAALEISLFSPKPDVTPIRTTAQADGDGKYVYIYQMNDYNFLGRVVVEAVATSNKKSTTITDTFLLDTWGTSLTESIPQFKYIYPLVP